MVNYLALELPTPFQGQTVQAYLILHEPTTLIDCGVYTEEAKLSLAEQLANHGLGFADIKRILITHAHMDHFGLAKEIQCASKATVYMHSFEVHRAQNHADWLHWGGKSLRSAGLPEKLYQEQVDYNNWEMGFLQVPEEIVAVEDHQIFAFDKFEIEGILTPGHSSGHLSFYQKDAGLIFSGDTVFRAGIPCPLQDYISPEKLIREKGLIRLLDSINRLKKLETKMVLPGHGEPFADAEGAVSELSSYFQKGKNKTRQMAARLKVFTPFELVMKLWPGITGAEGVYYTLSLTIGYLDLLEAEGAVIAEQTKSGITYFFNSAAEVL